MLGLSCEERWGKWDPRQGDEPHAPRIRLNWEVRACWPWRLCPRLRPGRSPNQEMCKSHSDPSSPAWVQELWDGGEKQRSRQHARTHTHTRAAQLLCPSLTKTYTYSASQAAPGGSVATGDTAAHRHNRKSPVHTSSGGAGLSSLGALRGNKRVSSRDPPREPAGAPRAPSPTCPTALLSSD